MTGKKAEMNLVKIYADEPAEEEIDFGFDTYAKTLAGLIANKENQTPLVIGIYGSWGTGKTTLMQAIQDRLDNQKIPKPSGSKGGADSQIRPCKTVWFQAWKYDKENEILAGLLEAIFQAMGQDGFFSQDGIKANLEKLAKGLNKKKILGFVTKLTTGVDISDFFQELAHKKHLGFYDIFRYFFDDLIGFSPNRKRPGGISFIPS